MARERAVDLEAALEHGLTEEEYGWIVDKLGRIPTPVELGIYSVMWSEHCSYKNSIALLKKLPRSGDALLVEAGDENAGLVDIGGGLACAFKIESHNHPSAVEPYQGAATGVGGIQRDIFTMGARPIASLNSLRFGSLTNPRVRFLLDGVVRGIGDYGNAFGVPTVGGEVVFDPAYEGNPLVNAMSVGIVEVGKTASAIAQGAGKRVYIVGSATGRDGIHGATFASEEISEASEAKRPSVQVGDPFTEKLLLEATLEAIDAGVVSGIQDMGAAGITCSSCEMSAKGECGMTLYLERVPIRETGMTPYEIMLSESQERMLIVAEPGRESDLEAIFAKWDLKYADIGEVTDGGEVVVLWHGEEVARVPADHLVLGGGVPVYYRETRKPDYLDVAHAFDQESIDDPDIDTAAGYLLDLMGSPNIASKRWVFEQYDTQVRTNTLVGPGASDAAVVRVKGTDKALAMATDCNGRYVYLNPRKGGRIAVAEAARNVVCAGGRPVAVTNCLNFGNPYKPEVYWVFTEAVGGMGDACAELGTPVTGGNVSFYNENPDGAVFPTPTIGMLGVVDDLAHVTPAGAQSIGDTVFLLSPIAWAHRNDIGGTEYLAFIHKQTAGDAPHFNLYEERYVQTMMQNLIREGWVQSAHDLSDGGLAACLAEVALFSDGLGIDVELEMHEYLRTDAALFGEAQSRIVFTVSAERADDLEDRVEGHGVKVTRLGVVTGDGDLSIRAGDRGTIRMAGADLGDRYHNSLRRALEEPAALAVG